MKIKEFVIIPSSIDAMGLIHKPGKRPNNRFGFNKMLPRICSHNTYHQLSIAKDVKRARNNYNRLTDMAREYVASRKMEDNRL